MTGLAVFALVMAAVLALGLALVPEAASRRRRRIALAQGLPPPVTGGDRKKRQRLRQTLRVQLGETGTRDGLRLALGRAGLRISPALFMLLAAGPGLLLFFGFEILGLPVLLALGLAPVGAFLLALAFLRGRQRRYREAFSTELPNAIDAIVRGVRAGLPLQETARLVAREASEPLRSEFQRMLDQVALGQTLPDAALSLHERVPSPDVKFFAVVLAVQAQAGGNLSEALGNLSAVLRTRKRMEARVKALSSEARTSALIIGSLPFAIGLIVSLTTPDYMAPLLTTPVGQVCLAIAAALMGVGILVMRRMIRFEV